MKIGMLWFDNDPRTDLFGRVQRAVDYYLQKYERMPDRCYLHPSEIPEEGSHLMGPVQLVPSENIRRNHLWIGCQEDE